MRDSSDDEGTGGEVVWLRDPGADPQVVGPVPLDLSELDELVDEVLANLGQVAVVGTVHRMRRQTDALAVELGDDQSSKLIGVFLGDQDGEFAIGDRVTAVGWLRCRGAKVILADGELFPPVTTHT